MDNVEKEVDRIIDSQDNEYVLSKPKYAPSKTGLHLMQVVYTSENEKSLAAKLFLLKCPAGYNRACACWGAGPPCTAMQESILTGS